MRLRWMLVIMCGMFCASAAVIADTIFLKNGNTVSGEIIKQDDQQIKVDIPGWGTVALTHSEIDSIGESKSILGMATPTQPTAADSTQSMNAGSMRRSGGSSEVSIHEVGQGGAGN